MLTGLDSCMLFSKITLYQIEIEDKCINYSDI